MSRSIPSAGEKGMVLLYFVFLLGMLALLATMLAAMVLPGASAPIDVVQGSRMQARIGTARNILLAYSEGEPGGARSMTRENCLMLDEARVSLADGQGSWSFSLRLDGNASCQEDSVRFRIGMDADGAGFTASGGQTFTLKDGKPGIPGRNGSGVKHVKAEPPASSVN